MTPPGVVPHRRLRATNNLTVGQIYLKDNLLLREPLDRKHVKPRLLDLGARRWG